MTSKCTLFINTDGTQLREDCPENSHKAAQLRLLSLKEAHTLIQALHQHGFQAPADGESVHWRFIYIKSGAPGMYSYTAPDGQMSLIKKDADGGLSFEPLDACSRNKWISLDQLPLPLL
jgi:hypothetical protein